MKNFGFVALALAMAIGTSAATLPTCSSSGASETTLNTTGYSCEIGDKIFSNFSISGADPNLIVAFTGSGLGPYNVITSDSTNAALVANFTLSYTITVDPSMVPPPAFNYIFAVGAGGVDSFQSVAANDNVISGIGNLNSVDNGTSGFGTVTAFTSGFVTTLNVTENYVWTSGATATAIQDTFLQAQSSGVPEPGSMMLLGSGLVAFAFAGRKLVRR